MSMCMHDENVILDLNCLWSLAIATCQVTKTERGSAERQAKSEKDLDTMQVSSV